MRKSTIMWVPPFEMRTMRTITSEWELYAYIMLLCVKWFGIPHGDALLINVSLTWNTHLGLLLANRRRRQCPGVDMHSRGVYFWYPTFAEKANSFQPRKSWIRNAGSGAREIANSWSQDFTWSRSIFTRWTQSYATGTSAASRLQVQRKCSKESSSRRFSTMQNNDSEGKRLISNPVNKKRAG